MRKLLLGAALAALMPSAANAATWVAQCMGGIDLQYNQTIGGKGFVHMQMGDGSYQTLPLTQTFYDKVAVCGAVDADAALASNVAQVCANKSRDSIDLKYRDPKATGAPSLIVVEYCKATITVY
jgi:hypothetical protein